MEKGYKKLELIFHYLDDTIGKKGLWLFKKGEPGTIYYFNNIDDGFGNQIATCEINNAKEGDQFGFITVGLIDGKPNWNNKIGNERFIRISKNLVKDNVIDIYILSENKNPKILFEKPKIINFHYRREREDYKDWGIYVYARGDFGNMFHFRRDMEHQGYFYAKVPVEFYSESPRKIWFKTVYEKVNNSPDRIKRFIPIDKLKDKQSIDVFIRDNDINIYYEKPKLLHTRVNVYYHRYDNDYFGWGLNYFLDKANNFQRHIGNFGEYGGDSLFKKVTFEIDYTETSKELCSYLRNNQFADSVDYRRVPLEENNMDIYIVEGIFVTFKSRKEAILALSPKINKAVLDNPDNLSTNFNTLWLETNIPLSEDIISNVSNFSITCTNKSQVNILKVQYSDLSKRRFKLTLSDNSIKPFHIKYNFKINYISKDKSIRFDKAKRISIERLYDHKEFNQRFCYLHENIGMDLGLIYNNDNCQFTLWSPTADKVKLNIYENYEDITPMSSINMSYGSGLWFIKFEGEESLSLKGKFYTFEIIKNNISREVVDPYAKSCSINALKGAIISLDDTNPEGWENHPRPNEKLENPIIYEMHIKDFTMGIGSDVTKSNQGKYLGVIEKIDYLKSLGVNCVQLLPVTKFDSDEENPETSSYNWGYDQTGLWFIPEGIYSTNPKDPCSRIKEFKKMVMELHKNGIRVIIDGVHNHTNLTENSLFNKIIKGYYYRQVWDDSFSNGSGCGNELKTERPIVRKLVRDYLKYWIKIMGIDGFRFDLMSLTDKYTMEMVVRDISSINPYVLLYGEAYKMGWSILPYDMQSSKENITQKELSGVGAFTDIGSRNAIRGYNWETGLSNGAPIDSISSHLFYIGQRGEFIDLSSRNNETNKVFNYIDIHDDLLLLDYLKLPHLQLSKNEIMQRYKLAYTMLFNYIGPIVLKAGFEVLTTKSGDFNSYKTEDVNLINWTRAEKFSDIRKYFSDYINFRKSHPAYIMSRHDVNSKFEILDCHNGYVKGKMFKDYANGDPFNKIAIFHNLSKIPLDVHLPEVKGGWALVANDETVGNRRIGNVINEKFTISPLTTIVLADNSSVERIMKYNKDPLSYLQNSKKEV